MASKETFKKALSFTLVWEGGFSNHPKDKGGATNKGIPQTTYNRCRKAWGLRPCDVRYIGQEELERIYFNDYWEEAFCPALNSLLAICHFDWAVNHGTHGAIQTLQCLVNCKPDGVFGNKTREALNNYVAKNTDVRASMQYCALRERWYRSHGIGEQEVFLQGWVNRVAALRSFLDIA